MSLEIEGDAVAFFPCGVRRTRPRAVLRSDLDSFQKSLKPFSLGRQTLRTVAAGMVMEPSPTHMWNRDEHRILAHELVDGGGM